METESTNTTAAPSAVASAIPTMPSVPDFETLARLAARIISDQVRRCDSVRGTFYDHQPTDREIAEGVLGHLRYQGWPPPDAQTLAAAVAEGQRRYDASIRRGRHKHLIGTVGQRYADATLESYRIEHDAQRPVVDAISKYADNIIQNVAKGVGIVLFGPCGTGKDHLLIGLGRRHIDAGGTVAWVSGQDLFAEFRQAIRDDDDSEGIVSSYVDAEVLILSDPVPTKGTITDYQEATLYRIIDGRYRALRPTWVSMNVADGGDADARLGSAIVDRLRDGALCLKCDWPSYRKAQA